jgi:hypothetical protein
MKEQGRTRKSKAEKDKTRETNKIEQAVQVT